MLTDNTPCLPLIEERHRNAVRAKYKIPYIYPELNLYVFPQVWGSTALGFSGIGGQAMTSAYTTVVRDEQDGYYSVFFGDVLAYTVSHPTDKFFKDLYAQEMEPVARAGRYRHKYDKEDNPNDEF